MADEHGQMIVSGLEDLVEILGTYPVHTESFDDGRWGLHIENEAFLPMEEAW